MTVETGDLGESTNSEIDLAIREIVEMAFGRAFRILQDRRVELGVGVKLLLEHETLEARQFEALRPRPTPVEGRAAA